MSEHRQADSDRVVVSMHMKRWLDPGSASSSALRSKMDGPGQPPCRPQARWPSHAYIINATLLCNSKLVGGWILQLSALSASGHATHSSCAVHRGSRCHCRAAMLPRPPVLSDVGGHLSRSRATATPTQRKSKHVRVHPAGPRWVQHAWMQDGTCNASL